ncbi:MAG: hypothetical protein ABIS67_07700 [Candidatus Eisenbacteria bacterium]
MPALSAAPEAAAARAGVVLIVALAALVLLRAWGTFVPGMFAWGINHVRFVAPPLGWPLLVLSLLVLLPWLARPVTPLVVGVGDLLAQRPVVAASLAAVSGAAIVLAFPDQLRFVGDFLLRQGTVEEAGKPGVLFPQALPLDVFLHLTLPTRIMETGLFNANGAARAIGAVEAGLLAVLAVMLARVLALRGAAAVAAVAIVWWSGALTMFTGYSKAFAELALLSAAAAVFALRSLRHGTPPLGLGIVLGLGLTLHRSALGLAPVWLLTWAMWAWSHGRAGGWRRPPAWIALAIPALGLGFMLPRIIATFLRWDAVHLTPETVRQQGGPLQAAFAGPRALDLANLLMVLSPALLALLAALVAFGRGLPRRREALLLLALVAPLAGIIPFIHPAQGLFRDWDDFASAAAALGVAGAWVAGEILRGAPRLAWLAPALVLAVAAPTLQWLAVQNDLERGLRRTEALVMGPPRRVGPEWGNTWDYLGVRNYRLERWESSARAFGNAARTSPSPRILLQWGLAESRAGNFAESMRAHRILVERNPDDYLGWGGIASAASQMKDVAAAREAAREMNRIRPGDRNAQMLVESIEEYLQKHPETPR